MAKGADTSRVGALYEKAKKSLKLHDIFCFFDSIESNDDEDKSLRKGGKVKKQKTRPFIRPRLQVEVTKNIFKFLELLQVYQTEKNGKEWSIIFHDYMYNHFFKACSLAKLGKEHDDSFYDVFTHERVRRLDELLSQYVENSMGDVGIGDEKPSISTAWSILFFLRSLRNDRYSCTLGHELSRDIITQVLSSQLKPNPIQIELHSKEEMADEVLRWATIDDPHELKASVRAFAAELRGLNSLESGDIVALETDDSFVFARWTADQKTKKCGVVTEVGGGIRPVDKVLVHPLPNEVQNTMRNTSNPTDYVRYVSTPLSKVQKEAIQWMSDGLVELLDEKFANVHLLKRVHQEGLDVSDLPRMRVLVANLKEFNTETPPKAVTSLSADARARSLTKLMTFSESEQFLPSMVDSFKQLRQFPFESLLASHLSRFVADAELGVDKIKSKIDRFSSGATKRQLTEWWLEEITDHSMEFLVKIGYDHQAYPDDYTKDKPDSLEGAVKNLKLLKEVLNPKEDVHNVKALMDTLKSNIYPRIDQYVANAKVAVAEMLGIPMMCIFDFDENFSAPEMKARLLKLESELGQEKSYAVSEMIKDIEYLEKMKNLESSKRRTRTLDVVPITGLVIGLFVRLENECKTVLELWRPVAKRAIGGSQLHQAVSDGNLERVKELLSGSEVNPNKPDVSGWTLAHIATMSATDRDTLKICSLLLDHYGDGIDFEAENSDGNTPLHFLVRSVVKDDAVEQEQIELLSRIMQSGANLGAQNNKGETPLHISCLHGNYSASKLLLEKGADPNAQTKTGESALHCAVRINMTRMVVLLMNNGADTDVKDNEGCSPFDCAVQLGCHDAELALKGAGQEVRAVGERRSSFAIMGSIPTSSGWRRMQPKNKSGRSHIVLRSRIESTDSFLTLGDAAEPPSPLQIRRPRHRDRSQWQAGLPEFRSDSSTESDSTQPPFLSRMNSRDEGLALTENVK